MVLTFCVSLFLMVPRDLSFFFFFFSLFPFSSWYHGTSIPLGVRVSAEVPLRVSPEGLGFPLGVSVEGFPLKG